MDFLHIPTFLLTDEIKIKEAKKKNKNMVNPENTQLETIVKKVRFEYYERSSRDVIGLNEPNTKGIIFIDNKNSEILDNEMFLKLLKIQNIIEYEDETYVIREIRKSKAILPHHIEIEVV